MKGFFVMIDGLDGSGKGTVVDALKNHLEKTKKVFDLKVYEKEKNEIPELDEVKEYDVLISSEPTYACIGRVIRDEIVRDNKRRYSALTTAHAFALDREILYRKLLVPALHLGKTVIQERGVVTSLVYQPVQHERLTLMDIINIPGNRLALEHPPDVLIITQVSPETVIQRLKQREHKKDNAIFEELVFQRKIAERYESDWLKKIFESKKSRVMYLNTDKISEEETKQKAVAVWEEIAQRRG